MKPFTVRLFTRLVMTAAICVSLTAGNAQAARSDAQNPQPAEHEDKQCISLVRECFSYHGFNRSNCFFTSATHPFCEGSELGALAYRRWVLSPNEPVRRRQDAAQAEQNQETAAQAFLGPQVVDPACIDATDDRLASSLRIDSISVDTVRRLAAGLEACRKDIGLELQRP